MQANIHNILNPQSQEFQEMSIQPKKGDMFIFPSTLRHSVPPQGSEEERIMVAGNIWYNSQESNFIHGNKKYNIQP